MPRVKKNSYDEYNSAFPSRLRYLMAHGDTNQQKLADFIGVTRQAVSAYTLGISLPDIEKFEKIAVFFGVSTEYLLGRTNVMENDMEKQAIAKALQLSEYAIDRIVGLQSESDDNGNAKKPLAIIFDRWLQFVDLEELIGNVCGTVQAAAKSQASGYFPEQYALDEDGKSSFQALEKRGYAVLTPAEQMSLYEQRAAKIFVQSLEKLQTEAMEAANLQYASEKAEADGAENDAEGWAR
ncbi:MAG: helix-turn-helix domain-containing protein [Oscillospiraceae bacterium]|nr:helix-turn-helix domain-containing protein [Oscillospiraceae bacterium]